MLRPLKAAHRHARNGGPQTDAERAEIYFRTAPIFETGDDRYAWLNDIVAVGLGASVGGAVRYDVFELL